MRVALGISGATGAVYGVRLLEELAKNGVEVHLVVSRWGAETVRLETGKELEYLDSLAFKRYETNNMGASISSGSFPIDGVVIAPCSMKTLAGVANGYADNLLVRMADVALKERRPLILVPRETPLNQIHLENMLKVSKAGALIMPPMPAFYNLPQTLDDMVNHFVGRIMDQLGLKNSLVDRWNSQ